MKKILKIVLPFAFGIFLCGYAYNKLSSDEIQKIKDYFSQANYTFVWLSVLFGALSHISRGMRWRYTLESIGYYPKTYNLILPVFISYLLNLTIPRSGEVSRALTLKQYENIPFEKSFGTIIAERIIDFLIMLLFIMTTLIIQFELIWDFIISKISLKSILIFIGITIPLCFLFLVWIHRSKNHIALKIKNLFHGFKDGLLSIFRLKEKWKFIAHTIFIWTMYVLMFYIVFFSFKQTENINIGDIITSFVIGSFAIIFTNGGLGSYPLFIAEILFIFKIDYSVATALGWLIWVAQFLMILIGGLISITLLPILNTTSKIQSNGQTL